MFIILFIVHNYFFVKIIFRTVKCKLDDYSGGLEKNYFHQGRFVYLRMQTQNEKNASAIKSCLPLYFNEKLYLIFIFYSTEKLVNIWCNYFLLPVSNPRSS